MKVNKYKIGRYHAIIKKIYEDGSISYETQFSDSTDLSESVYAIRNCIGELVGIATDNPRVLKDCIVITGKENIIKELECIEN
jgi:antitoxin component YwqK of YwqJK toxin-antitoxin module